MTMRSIGGANPYATHSVGTYSGRIGRAGASSGSSGGGGGSMATTAPKASTVYNKLQADYEAAKVEQQKRYEQGLADLAKVTGLFGPDYGAGMEQAALAGAKQSLIGRGLGGSTRATAVSAGMKAQFEDLRKGKIAEALTRTADYRRTSPLIYPGAGTLAGLASGTQVSPSGPTIIGGSNAPTYMPSFYSLPNYSSGFGNIGTPNFNI